MTASLRPAQFHEAGCSIGAAENGGITDSKPSVGSKNVVGLLDANSNAGLDSSRPEHAVACNGLNKAARSGNPTAGPLHG